jgi:hypothetical protein
MKSSSDNKERSFLLKGAIILVGLYFIYQSGFNFGFGDKSEAPEVASPAVIGESKVVVQVLPELIKSPEKAEDDFLLMLKAYSESWFAMNLEEETFEEIAGKKKVLEGLNWLMEKRAESLEVPGELTNAIRRYAGDDEGKIKQIAGFFADKRMISLVREYDGGNWKVSLRYIPEVVSGSAASAVGSSGEVKEFKLIGVD